MSYPEADVHEVPRVVKIPREVAEHFRQLSRELYDDPLTTDDDLFAKMKSVGIIPDGSECLILEEGEDGMVATTEPMKIECDFCSVSVVLPAGTPLPKVADGEAVKFLCGSCSSCAGDKH